MNRRISIAVALLVCCGGLCVSLAADDAGAGVLQRHLPGFEIARFLPSEGRLVLEHPETDRLVVLRQDDELGDGGGAILESIGPWGAVLLIGGRAGEADIHVDPTAHTRLLLLPNDGGGFKVLEVTPSPDGMKTMVGPGEFEVFVIPAEPGVGDTSTEIEDPS
jgi:hypothetical protein